VGAAIHWWEPTERTTKPSQKQQIAAVPVDEMSSFVIEDGLELVKWECSHQPFADDDLGRVGHAQCDELRTREND